MRIRFEPPRALPAEPPRPVDEAVAEVRARTGLSLEAARVRLGFSRGHLLDAVVSSAAFPTGEDERALAAAELLLVKLLGDAVFDDWIGRIDVTPAARGGSLRVVPDGTGRAAPEALELSEVRAAVDAAVAGVDAGLPDAPCHAVPDGAEWTLLEGTPEVRDDYAAQDDVLLFSTRLPEAMKCFLERAPFSSRRFSKHGERFVYLKTDAEGRSPEARYAFRLELEELVDRALRPDALGCVVGGGIGLRYVFVVAALSELERGVDALCRAARDAGAGRRSWVLFCDSEWAEEFAPVWEDGTEPPGG